MPKRTNDFQQLVKLVQQALAPKGANVRESVEAETQDGSREIDVLLESALGVYHLKIAVEAKGHGRPLDVETAPDVCVIP